MTEIRDNKSAEINELAAALSKAQAEFTGAKKDSKNPFFKSNYASIESVIESTKEALAKHGLSVSQPTEPVDGRDYVRTTLFHSSGQLTGSILSFLARKKTLRPWGRQLATRVATLSRGFSILLIMMMMGRALWVEVLLPINHPQ